jgi:hypothetical protein
MMGSPLLTLACSPFRISDQAFFFSFCDSTVICESRRYEYHSGEPQVEYRGSILLS